MMYLAYQPGFWHIKYVWSTFGSTEFGGVFIRYMCISQYFLSQPSPPSIPSTTKPRYPYAEADGDLDRIDCVFRGTHPELMGSVCLNSCVISMWKFFIQFHHCRVLPLPPPRRLVHPRVQSGWKGRRRRQNVHPRAQLLFVGLCCQTYGQPKSQHGVRTTLPASRRARACVGRVRDKV